MKKVYAYFVKNDVEVGFIKYVVRFRVDDTITDYELNDVFEIDYIVRAAVYPSNVFMALRLSKDGFKNLIQNGISRFSDAGVIVRKLNGKYEPYYKD